MITDMLSFAAQFVSEEGPPLQLSSPALTYGPYVGGGPRPRLDLQPEDLWHVARPHAFRSKSLLACPLAPSGVDDPDMFSRVRRWGLKRADFSNVRVWPPLS